MDVDRGYALMFNLELGMKFIIAREITKAILLKTFPSHSIHYCEELTKLQRNTKQY